MTGLAGPQRTDRFVSQAPKLGYAGPLDGVRAVALIMVLFAHISFEWFSSFAGSVDMFFVVSGFLITTLILEEDRAYGHVDVGRYYLRRVFRLFPVLYAVLAATLASTFVVGTRHFRNQARNDVLAAALYVYHVVHPVHGEVIGECAAGTPKLQGCTPYVRPLVQLWSLSVEEHFYLVALALLIVVIRFRLARHLIVVFSAIWLFVAAARLTGHVGWDLMWYQRPDALLIGVVAALVHAVIPPELPERVGRVIRAATTAALAVMVVALFVGTVFADKVKLFVALSPRPPRTLHSGLYWGQFGFTICSLAVAMAVFTMVRYPDYWLCRPLSWGPLRALGRRSYCVYLVHVPLFLILDQALTHRFGGGAVGIAYLVLFPLSSEILHRYVEKPGLRFARRFSHAAVSGRLTAGPVD